MNKVALGDLGGGASLLYQLTEKDLASGELDDRGIILLLSHDGASFANLGRRTIPSRIYDMESPRGLTPDGVSGAPMTLISSGTIIPQHSLTMQELKAKIFTIFS